MKKNYKEESMKKVILLVAISLLLVSLAFANQSFEIGKMVDNPQSKSFRAETSVFLEDFENGLTWDHYDGAEPNSMWHLINNHPLVYNNTGYSWFMGDHDLGANGGYLDAMYLVLDTPSIVVPTDNSTLTFKLNYHVEDPGMHEGYDGWDGCNLRISTDDGATWEILTPTTPAYNATSMYSFGFVHGEGMGIPGWGGNTNGWVDASANLSQYAGQSVKIRFAFASDPAYNTTNDAQMFGMCVDNISLGSFNENFDDGQEHGMTYASLVPLGGDLWHIQEYAMAASGSHVLACQNAAGTYNPNMYNYIESESISLPISSEIRADFMVRGGFSDSGTFPDVDYWGWEISIDGGVSWRYMSNPYQDENGNNYVYSDAPDEFWSFVEAYSSDGYISNFAGQDIIFRWFFQSNGNTPIGEGLMIDDVQVFANVFAPSPSNLTAVKNGDDIDLSWTLGGGETGEIRYYSDNITFDGIGLNADSFPLEFSCAIKVPAEMAANYTGSQITKVKFYPNNAFPFTVKIWKGGSGSTLVSSEVATGIVAEQWKEVTLTDPVTIEYGTDYWIGYTVAQQAANTHPAGFDSGNHVENGEMVNTGSAWQSLYAASGGSIDGNWLIAAIVETGTREYTIDTRAVDNFNVYHKEGISGTYALLSETAADSYEYTHNNPTGNQVHYYNVTTVWDGIESDISNEANEYMSPAGANEFICDDGTAESGFAHTGFIANQFFPNYTSDELTIQAVKFYVHTKTASNMSLKIWAPDSNNLPGEEIYTQTVTPTMVNAGWNYIIIPDANQPVINTPNFFIGFQESAGSQKIGVDADNNGNSYKKTTSGAWTLLTDSNYMIRAYGSGALEVNDIPVVLNKLTANNYPNPFNPTTNIAFNMPANGHASVKIYNAKGQLVKTLFNGALEAGQKTITWNGVDNNNTNVGSGVYFYKVEANGQSVMKKMLLMK
jgi:hypothetical protein